MAVSLTSREHTSESFAMLAADTVEVMCGEAKGLFLVRQGKVFYEGAARVLLSLVAFRCSGPDTQAPLQGVKSRPPSSRGPAGGAAPRSGRTACASCTPTGGAGSASWSGWRCWHRLPTPCMQTTCSTIHSTPRLTPGQLGLTGEGDVWGGETLQP